MQKVYNWTALADALCETGLVRLAGVVVCDECLVALVSAHSEPRAELQASDFFEVL